ncbi:MAG TPA: TadE/TadG family type IV pilus assembly protein [Terracidiphilus sp.]|jgi:Flp pilus assembly protein TadG
MFKLTGWRGQHAKWPMRWKAIGVDAESAILPRARLFRSGEEGNALVEFALMLPVMLLIMTGIFSIGIAYSNELTLTQAVGAGAQYLQQIRTSSSDPCADTFTAITNAAPNLRSANISVTITMNGVTPDQTGNSCSGAQTNLVQGANVTVNATYPCNITVYKFAFSSSCLLTAQVTEYEY